MMFTYTGKQQAKDRAVVQIKTLRQGSTVLVSDSLTLIQDSKNGYPKLVVEKPFEPWPWKQLTG